MYILLIVLQIFPLDISYAISWKILSKKSRNFIFDDYFLYSPDLLENV